ncbi:MAG TPA: oligosaccharide flippase family protein [Rhodanobacteraceae bacterium]|nr:oligosaccharide flippase family protein [Rhodanobacteraceae bacterium]
MLSRSYLIVTFGFGFRSLLLSVLAVLLARALGPSAFGAYAAAASLASFFAMFSGFGAGPLHVRDVAHAKKPYVESLNRTMQWVGLSALPLAALAGGCAWLVIPHSVTPLAITLIVLGEILYYGASDLAMRILQAREHYTGMTLAVCALPALRVVIAALFFAFGILGLMSWSFVSLATGGFAFLAVFGAWGWRMRGNFGGGSAASHDTLAGLGFAVSTASSRVHGDADKVILARLASTAIAGTYTLAYRLVDIFLLPISAGVERLLPALFKQGQHGLRESLKASAGKIALTLAFALCLCVGVYAAAYLLPWILGAAYREAIPIAHALAAVPLTMACWVIVRTLAATSGYERATGAFELGGAIFNVGASIMLVVAWGWRGAVAATYLTHFAMVASFAAYIGYRAKFTAEASEEIW